MVYYVQKFNAKTSAFLSGDKCDYANAKRELRKCVKSAKREYQRQLEVQLTTTNPRDLWNGVRKIADYNFGGKPKLPDDPILPNGVDSFYSRFDHNFWLGWLL